MEQRTETNEPEDWRDIKTEGIATWLKTFFAEKNLPSVNFHIQTGDGWTHVVDSDWVILYLLRVAEEDEQENVRDMVVRIDFVNGDIMHYLGTLAEQFVKTDY
jgi:hypothetical protein